MDAHILLDVEAIASQVLRTDLTRPGFALADLGPDLEPRAFREALAALALGLDHYYRAHFGGRLVPWSVSRFDQQASTRPHRDGGPDGSVLLLGYEPTEARSRVSLLDHTRKAQEMGMTPTELLARHNPAFQADLSLFADCTTELEGFDPAHYLLLALNNSTYPLSEGHTGMLGVLHQAVILTPTLAPSRWINSVLLARRAESDGGLSPEQLEAFVRDGRAAAVGSG